MLGAIGLPVFSGFSGGIFRLFDATGGYIFGLFAAALLWWLLEKILPEMRAKKAILSSASLITIYTLGTLWFAFVYAGGASSLGAVLATCVLPFIIPDVIKICLAYYISKKIPKL